MVCDLLMLWWFSSLQILFVVLSGGHQKSQLEVAVRDRLASSFRAQDNIEKFLPCSTNSLTEPKFSSSWLVSRAGS